MFMKLQIAYFHLFHGVHLSVRLMHDKLYHKGKLYKRWTDKPYAETVHKISLVTVVVTFFVLSLLQMLAPGLQNAALAGANTTTWTTTADFTNNAVTGKGATLINSNSKINVDNVALNSQILYFENASKVIAGYNQSFAIKTDGTLWSWGNNSNGQLGLGDSTQRSAPTQVGTSTNWKVVATGNNHTLAIKTDGTLWAWGYNYYGQLGLGDMTQRNIPVQVGNLTDWQDVTTGDGFTLALKTNGTLWSWGTNSFGQLGLGDNVQRTTPSQIGLDSNWLTVFAGGYNSLAIKADGTLWSWGHNSNHQLGLGDTTQRKTPIQVGTDMDWQSVSAGAAFGIARKTGGTLWAWGYNGNAQLGLGDTTERTLPTQIGSDTSWQSVHAGSYHVVATKADNSVWAWGFNYYGQLGVGDYAQHQSPTQVSAAVNWQGITTGTCQTLFAKTDGSIWATGVNDNGQLGDGTVSQRSTPIKVIRGVTASSPLSDVKKIADGFQHTLAIKNDKTIWAWGKNDYGQLGNGTTLANSSPAQVKDSSGVGYLSGIVGIDSDSFGSIAVKDDGTVWAWGWNDKGQLGQNTSDSNSHSIPAQVKDSTGNGFLTNVRAVAMGGSSAYALKNDGTVWAWGENGSGQLGQNTADNNQHPLPVQVKVSPGTDNLTSVSQISASGQSVLAIKVDQTLWAWGYNCGDGTSSKFVAIQVKDSLGTGYLTNIVSVAAGGTALAVKADGTVWAWGQNGNGQLGQNTSDYNSHYTPLQVKDSPGTGFFFSASMVAIAKGYSHSVILRTDGTVWGMGYDGRGQLGDGNNSGNRLTPVQAKGPGGVGSLTNVTSIAAANYRTNVSKGDGTVWGMGFNAYTELGNNSTGDTSYPSQAIVIDPVVGFSSPGTISNLKLSSATKASWASISWNTAALPANTNVKFRLRSAASEGGLASATWSSYFVQNTVGSTSGSASATSVPANYWLEAEMTLESTDGISTPTLNDFTVSYDTLEAPQNNNLTLFRVDNTTFKDSSASLISAGNGGAWSNQTTLRMAASGLTCTSCATAPTNLRPQVEIKPTGTAFDGTTGVTAASAGNAYVDIPNLTPGAPGYHLQVRAIDDQGRVSGWTSYGNNTESIADLTIDQAIPTGTVTINSGAAYASSANVTLTNSAADTGGSGLTQMQFSNDGTSWSGWETYNATKSWTLSTGDGTKTVYAQYRDNAGNVSGTWIESKGTTFSSGTSTGDLGISGGQLSLSSNNWLVVGNQVWMKKSLNVGTLVNNTQSQTDNGLVEKYCYGNLEANCATLGALYQWNEVMNYQTGVGSQGICPLGTHVPTRQDFITLEINAFGVNPVTAQDDYWHSAGTGGNLMTNFFGTRYYRDSNSPYAIFGGGSQTTSFTWLSDYAGYYAYGNDSAGIRRLTDNVNYGRAVRCIADGSTISLSGNYESVVRDNLVSQNYGKLTWLGTTPTAAGNDSLKFQVASNNDNATWNYTGLDGTSATYYTTSGTQIHSSHNGKRYIRYKAYLKTDNVGTSPTLSEVSIEVSTIVSSSVTLDTVKPDSVMSLSAYKTNTKITGLTSNNWYNATTAYFEWNTSTDTAPSSGIAGYKYCFDKVSNNCVPTTQTAQSNYMVSSFPAGDGMYNFKVIAVDNSGNESTTPTVFTFGRDVNAPSAVSGFSASQDDPVNINLAWTAYNDGNSPVINYQIQRVKKVEYDALTLIPSGDWSSAVGLATISCGAITAMTEDNVGVTTMGCNMDAGIAINQAYSYAYRIRAKDSANPTTWGSWTTNVSVGMNADVMPPSNPSSLVATPDVNGHSVHLTWNISNDTGSGLSRYFIWRRSETDSSVAVNKTTGADITNPDNQIWTMVGVLAPVGPESPQWEDNDANNDATALDKTSPSARLNDYVNYYYRISAVDITGNRSEIITTDPGTGFANNTNWQTALTPDVTNPASPTGVSATALGTDGVNAEPNNQQIDISWETPLDNRTPGRVPAGNGSGIASYKIYRATRNISGPTVAFAEIATRTVAQGVSYSDKGLPEDTYIYYKVRAFDVAGNQSVLSGQNPATVTKNSQVPTTPTGVRVQAIKGDPALDTNVGKQIVVSFNGSAIKFARNSISGYEVYRSLTNFADDASWLSATKVQEYKNLDITGYEGEISYDQRRQFTDVVTSDATTYYYRARALGTNSTLGPVQSSLSAVSVGILNAGWDITPDVTAPSAPLAVNVKDTFPNNVYVRNLVTWQIPTMPTRKKLSYETCNEVTTGHCAKFARYEVWREMTNPNAPSDPAIVTKIYETTNFYDNQKTDNIDISLANFRFDYYVITVDNSGTQFKYNNAPTYSVINGFSNTSAKRYAADSIIPAETTPRLQAGSQVVLSSVNVSSAVIEWDTNQRADSLVEYRVQGSSDAYVAVGDREPVTHHTVRIFDLHTDTLYEYRVVSRNKLGNDMVVDVVSYLTNYGQTLPALRTARFAIVVPGNDADFKNSTTSTVQFNWTTTKDAKTNYIEYEAEADPNNSQLRGIAGQLATSDGYNLLEHSVILKGLRSKTKYRFKIKSVSTDNYQAEAPDGAGNYYYFETTGFDTAQFTLAPSSSNVAERNITATTAQIAWETASLSTSWVDYGVSAGVLNQSAGNDDMTTRHFVKIEGLVPGTTYYYKVRVTDEFGNVYTSQQYSFTAVLKPKISNMRVSEVTPYKVTLTWETNVETETIINWGKTASYGEKRGKSGVSMAHELVIDNLEDNQEYHYQILAKDAASNEVADSDKIVRTPLDTEGPKITNVKIDVLPMGENDTTSSVIVSWQTNKPATTLVEYDEGVIGGTYGKRSVEDSSLNNSHTVIVKDLTAASSYHYRLVSRDKRGNKTVSQDYTFVTPSKEKSILQLILKSLEETFAWTRNLNQFFVNIAKRLTGR